jgi:branched-chain amino acid transport system substrate-binding protein
MNDSDQPQNTNQTNQMPGGMDPAGTSEPPAGTGTPMVGGPKKSRKMMTLWLVVALLLVLGAGAAYWMMQKKDQPVAKKAEPRSVKVGVLDPVSGVWTNVGTSIKSGIEFATKESAADGLTVTYIYKDTNCEAAKAEQAAKELVSEGVIAIIGDLCSGSTLAAVPIAAAAHIPVVSATSTNPKLTGSSPYFSRTIPSDALSSQFTADLFYKKAKFTKLAIIHSDDTYGVGLNDAVKAAFEKQGGSVVTSQSFKNESTNVSTQMDAIKTANPDALYIVTSSSVTWIKIMQSLKDMGLTFPVYSSESLKDLTFIKDAGGLAEGMFIIAVSDGTAAYVEKYQGAYGEDPGLYNAQAYDAARTVIEALNSGAKAGEEMRAAIRSASFDGASGHIKFDQNGDVSANFSVFKVVNGKFKAQQ